MTACFYHLYSPNWDEPHEVYGDPEWLDQFGRAEWSDRVGRLIDGRHAFPIGRPVVDLVIVLPTLKLGNFVWTCYSDCIVTDRTLSLFQQAGFTGFKALPVTVERVKRVSRKRVKEFDLPPLWELLIVGKGGDADPASGIHVIDRNEETGNVAYSSFRNGILVDENNWDGSDFFTVNGYPKFFLVSERVKDFIIAHGLTNCSLIPSHKLEWQSGMRPEDFHKKLRAAAQQDLESLLDDLADDNARSLMHAIFALGKKGDPQAIAPLTEKFDHPNPSIWTSAASAVAEIVRNRNTSAEVRDETISLLTSLLDQANYRVRKTAIYTLGYIGGEQQAQVVMRSLEDEDESVRAAALFILGYMRYNPAREAVKRLVRDPSKSVRVQARDTLKKLIDESEQNK